ncbi:hypothetical protein [Mycolicibacterium sp. HS_4_1]
MVYRIDFDIAPDSQAVVAELTATAAAAGAHMTPAFEDRAGRYRIEPWDITVDMDWQVHLSIPTRPGADPATADLRLAATSLKAAFIRLAGPHSQPENHHRELTSSWYAFR